MVPRKRAAKKAPAKKATPQPQVSSAISRPTRTAVQATPSVAIAAFIDAFVYDMSDIQFGAAVGLLTVLVGAVQNVVENHFGRGFLRRVPPTTDPVPGG